MSDQEGFFFSRWLTRRDADAFAELLSRHTGMVYGACRRITRDATAAEDITQECFLKLAQETAPIRSPGAWLHRVATCASLSWLRDEKRRARREKDFAEARAAEQEQPDPDWRALIPLVDTAINELPEKNRAAVVLRFLEGKSHGQIGRELGISRRAVQKRIEKGLQEIRDALGQTGMGLAVAGLAGLLELHMPAEAAPASLVAALGKQAIAAARFAPPAATTTLLTMGATIMTLKKAMVCVLVVAALGLGGASLVYREAVVDFLSGDNVSDDSASAQTAQQGVGRPANRQAAALQTQITPATDTSNAAADSAPAPTESTAEPANEEPSPKAPVTGAPATFAGLVYTGDMRPVAGARMLLYVTTATGESRAFESATGNDGRYVISPVTSFGGATLSAHAKDYIVESNSFTVKPAGKWLDADFLLTPAACYVRGVVVTPDGQPVDGAEVSLVVLAAPADPEPQPDGTVVSTGTTTSWSPHSVFTVTSSDGSFEIGMGKKGTCDFHVIKKEVGEGVFPGVQTGTEDARFVLTGFGAIEGTVLLADGQPAKAHTVMVIGEYPVDPNNPGPSFYRPVKDTNRSSQTDDIGYYRLELAPQSRYEIGVVREGGNYLERTDRGFTSRPLATRSELQVDAGETLRGIDFQLIENPYVRLYGHVYDRTSNEPVSGVNIGCSRMNPGKLFGVNKTDSEGAYELEFTLDAKCQSSVFGTYLSTLGGWGAQLEAADGQSSTVLDLAPGDEKELDWVTDAPVAIPIRVTNGAGAPLPGLWTGAGTIGKDGSREFSSARCLLTDANGQCINAGLPPSNTYFVWVQEYQRTGTDKDVVALAQSETISLAPGETAPEVVLVVEEKGGVEGVAVFEDGTPAGEIPLTISAEDGSHVTAVTKLDGAFTAVAAFRPGTYAQITVSATVEGTSFSAKLSEVEVLADAIVDLGAVVLVPVP